YGANDAINGIGVFGHGPSGGFGFKTDGHVQQDRDKGGWVKAMAYIDPFAPGGIAVKQCFNALTTLTPFPASGIHITHNGQGVNTIDFGFEVDDRFVLATTNNVGSVAFGILTTSVGTTTPCNCGFTSSPNQLTFITRGEDFADIGFWVFIF